MVDPVAPEGWYHHHNTYWSNDGRWMLKPCVLSDGFDLWERYPDHQPVYGGRFLSIETAITYIRGLVS